MRFRRIRVAALQGRAAQRQHPDNFLLAHFRTGRQRKLHLLYRSVDAEHDARAVHSRRRPERDARQERIDLIEIRFAFRDAELGLQVLDPAAPDGNRAGLLRMARCPFKMRTALQPKIVKPRTVEMRMLANFDVQIKNHTRQFAVAVRYGRDGNQHVVDGDASGQLRQPPAKNFPFPKIEGRRHRPREEGRGNLQLLCIKIQPVIHGRPAVEPRLSADGERSFPHFSGRALLHGNRVAFHLQAEIHFRQRNFQRLQFYRAVIYAQRAVKGRRRQRAADDHVAVRLAHRPVDFPRQ